MTDNEIKTVDISKYATALNNLIGIDCEYMKGDPDVDAIVEVIILAKNLKTPSPAKRQRSKH